MSESRSRSVLQSLAASQTEFREFATSLSAMLGIEKSQGSAFRALQERILAEVGQMQEAERQAFNEICTLASLLEQAYINSVDLEDAQFFLRELTMRAELFGRGRRRPGGGEATAWAELENRWRLSRSARSGDKAEHEHEEEKAVFLMQQLISERDEVAKEAMRGQARAEAELLVEKEAAEAARKVQRAQEAQLAELSTRLERLDEAAKAELQRTEKQLEGKLARLAEELAAKSEEILKLRELLATRSPEKSNQFRREHDEEGRRAVDRLLEERAQEREERMSLYAKLEEKDEEIKSLFGFKERFSNAQTELRRLEAEKNKIQTEFFDFHAELRKVAEKARSLGRINETLIEEKLQLQAKLDSLRSEAKQQKALTKFTQSSSDEAKSNGRRTQRGGTPVIGPAKGKILPDFFF